MACSPFAGMLARWSGRTRLAERPQKRRKQKPPKTRARFGLGGHGGIPEVNSAYLAAIRDGLVGRGARETGMHVN